MRRRSRFLAFVGFTSVMVPFGGLFSNAQAASAPVKAWIDVSSTRPAAGCTVDFSIELRTSGEPVALADVTTALFSGDDVVDTAKAHTNDAGVAMLSLDATEGVGDWIDINVGGVYLTGFSIVAGAGSSCVDRPKFISLSGDIPLVTAESGSGNLADAAGTASDAGPTVDVGGIIFYKQQRNLSCEYAALQIATAAWGDPVSEYSFDDVVGLSDNPHWGFRGDITGIWGNTTDYGVYNEPLATALTHFGFSGDAFYAQGDASELTSRLDAGVPTLVWIAQRGDRSEYRTTEDGTRYMMMAFYHVLVVYGYSDEGVYLSDPATASSKFYAWEDFMAMWNLMDGMGLGVSPA